MTDTVYSGALLNSPAVEISGSGGDGFIMLTPQTSAPLVSTGIKIYSAAGTSLCLISSDSSVVNLVASALTGPRTLNFPNHDGIIATTAGIETFTNKTIAGASNIVEASALQTAAAAVVVSAAAPPNPGQVLTATSATTAQWVNGPVGSGVVAYSLLPFLASINSTIWSNVSYFAWANSRYSGYTNGKLIFQININGPATNVRLRDITNNVDLAVEYSINISGIKILNVTNPTTNCVIALQVQKVNDNSPDPTILGATLEFTS